MACMQKSRNVKCHIPLQFVPPAILYMCIFSLPTEKMDVDTVVYVNVSHKNGYRMYITPSKPLAT